MCQVATETLKNGSHRHLAISMSVLEYYASSVSFDRFTLAVIEHGHLPRSKLRFCTPAAQEQLAQLLSQKKYLSTS